jgi:hypothetical protein
VERVVVEVCADRPCQRVEHTLEVTGSSVRVPEELRPGVHFWRAFALVDGRRGAGSFTWEFRAPFRSASSDLALASYVDVNGDGYGDAILTSGASNSDIQLNTLGSYVFYGSPGGPEPRPRQRLPFGLLFDIGDANGDGFSDVVIKINTQSGEEVQSWQRVFLGSAAGLLETTQNVPVEGLATPSRCIPNHLGGVPLIDVNLDGYGDVVASTEMCFSIGSPRALIFLGSAQGFSSSNILAIESPDPSYQYFGRLYPVGDFDGDNRLDYLVWGLPPDAGGLSYRPSFHVVSSEHVTDLARRGVRLIPPNGHRFIDPRHTDRLALCDLDRDGRSEVILQSTSEDPRMQRPLNVFLHLANTPNLSRTRMLDGGPLFDQRALRGEVADLTCVPDFDGDGFYDIVGTSRLVGWMMRGSADGPLPATPFERSFEPLVSDSGNGGRLALNDIDGDGRPECLSTTGGVVRFYSATAEMPELMVRYRLYDPVSPVPGAIFYHFGDPFLF